MDVLPAAGEHFFFSLVKYDSVHTTTEPTAPRTNASEIQMINKSTLLIAEADTFITTIYGFILDILKFVSHTQRSQHLTNSQWHKRS